MKKPSLNRARVKKLRRITNQINKLAPQMAALSDGQLKDYTRKFRQRLQAGQTLDSLLVEAFAVVREADRRVLGMFPYDVQVMGGIALYQGNIVEMKTGEGKTLTATMPLYLNGLSGDGAMLVTPNEYLAYRDGTEMGQVYEWLGLTCRVGFAAPGAKEFTTKDKRAAYGADITYTTNAALGFDYLFDNLATNVKNKFMRDFNYAIIDEADAVLLDSAVMPLVISGSPRVQSTWLGVADEFIYTLKQDEEYKYDKEDHAVWFTDSGHDVMSRYFAVKALFNGHQTELLRATNLALKAHRLFERDKDYVVDQDNQVELLDTANGRVMEGMKLQAGQHQAIEMKEQAEISPDTRTLASITYQNLFRKFKKLSGMTGTGKVAEKEFIETYYDRVIQIPTNRPVARVDLPDKVYTTLPEKLMASLQEVLRLHKIGRPILLVTANVEVSEIYSELLLQQKIPHSVLNAKNAAKEAAIIAEAGQKGAVTVATTMAGRGTDIKLGPGVKELGGLAVIGTEKMASKRIDQQLQGRAGRQGDPGTSQFYVSLEDHVVIKHGARWLQKYYKKRRRQMDPAHPKEITTTKFRRAIAQAQEASDSADRQQRRKSLEMDESAQIQRQLIIGERNRLLYGEKVDLDLPAILRAEFTRFFTTHPQLTVDQLVRYILDNVTYQYFDRPTTLALADQATVVNYLMKIAQAELARKQASFANAEEENDFYRIVVLKAIDECWVEEIDGLTQLQTIVASRSTAQRNPLYEYHKEALRSYNAMRHDLYHRITRHLLMSTIDINKKGEKQIYFV